MKEFYGIDIETRPKPEAELRELMPEFKAAKNLKDPEKIAADIADKQKAFFEEAALSPLYSSLCVVGVIDNNDHITYLEGDENHIIREFWDIWNLSHGSKFYFWSGSGSSAKMFDFDFIVTRSRIIGVPVPTGVRNGRFYSPRIVDLASEFLLYQNDQYCSLTRAAKLLGLYGEGSNLTPKSSTDEVTGKDFWLWYDGLAGQSYMPDVQRAKALNYLRGDLMHLPPLTNRIIG